jgi:hypothetical protein
MHDASKKVCCKTSNNTPPTHPPPLLHGLLLHLSSPTTPLPCRRSILPRRLFRGDRGGGVEQVSSSAPSSFPLRRPLQCAVRLRRVLSSRRRAVEERLENATRVRMRARTDVCFVEQHVDQHHRSSFLLHHPRAQHATVPVSLLRRSNVQKPNAVRDDGGRGGGKGSVRVRFGHVGVLGESEREHRQRMVVRE